MGKTFIHFVLLVLLVKSFTGANPTIYNGRDLGAKADGQSNDARIIQEILDQHGPETTVFLPAGTYLLTQPLVIRNDHIAIIGESPEKTILIFAPEKNQSKRLQPLAAINIWGLAEFQWYNISQKVTEDRQVIETDRLTNFSPGTLAEVAADFTETDFRRQKTILVRVAKTDGNRLFLEEPLPATFSPGPNCRIQRYLPKKNIRLENFTLQTSGQGKNNLCGLQSVIAENVNIKNLRIAGFEKAAVYLKQVYGCQITSSTFILKESPERRQNCALYLDRTSRIIFENNHMENYSTGILLNHFNFYYQFHQNTFINCRQPITDREKSKPALTSGW